ncbi:Hypothetical predicted protein [Cloeon dipterum]|uniref:Anillin homology domain-containing protein n=1 Tax=Cloeon dipterum TaxID=197152 RepID=A0A8S1CBK0_9INSE|nr:Hypothetical predicted protein [Cloeon dipterum]
MYRSQVLLSPGDERASTVVVQNGLVRRRVCGLNTTLPSSPPVAVLHDATNTINRSPVRTPTKIQPKASPALQPRSSRAATLAAKVASNNFRNKEELDLEQKIELEIKMREGSAKLLAASRQQSQTLEAARSLLTSNERMSAYMAELQRRKSTNTSQSRTGQSRARVSISELRMPLMWRGVDHFKNKGDYRRFAVFCLARLGTEIFDTTLVTPVDRSMTDVTFPDSIVFNDVPSDFTLRLEVYSHLLAEDLSMASAPRKLQRTIHSSISRTVGKKLAASLKDELHAKLGPQFHLVASANLNLADVDDGVRTHDLEIETLENRLHELPLFGHFCCRLAAQPNCMGKELMSGDVLLRTSAEASLTRAYLSLKSFNLSAWPSKQLVSEQQPASILVDKETTIQTGSNLIYVSRLDSGRQVTWAIESNASDDLQRWIKVLTKSSQDHARWGKASERLMDIPAAGTNRHSFMSTCSRQGSLYDQTPLIENMCSERERFGEVQTSKSRRTVQEIFGLTPATSLSSCASSTASSNSPPSSFRSRTSSGSGSKFKASLKGHWPFKSSG